MANEFFTASNAPATGSSLSSATIRAEIAAIEDGFDKISPMTGNAGKVVVINDGATAQSSVARDAFIAGATTAATSKATPVDADELPLADSAATFGLKKLTWANLKAGIKAYYDSVTATLTNKTLTSPDINGGTISGVTIDGNVTSTGNPSLNLGTGALTAGSAKLSPTASNTWISTHIPIEIGGGAVIGRSDAFGAYLSNNLYRATDGDWKYKATGAASFLLTTGNLTWYTGGSAAADSVFSAATPVFTASSTGLSLGSLGLTAGTGTFSGTSLGNVTAVTAAGSTQTLRTSVRNTYIYMTNGAADDGQGLFIDGTRSSLVVGGATIATASSTGLAVTGAVSATNGAGYGTANLSGTSGGYVSLQVNGTEKGNIYANNGGCTMSASAGLPLTFFPNATLAMTLDASGNLGLGVTPSAWGSGFKALQIYPGASGFVAAYGNELELGTSAYFDTSWKYQYSGVAISRYEQSSGAHKWYTAPSGTAGNAITFTQAMTLDASGNLLVGATAQISTEKISISAGANTGAFVKVTGVSNVVLASWNAATSGDNIFHGFYTEASATQRGSIDYNRGGAAVRYNTTSDGNLKNIIGDADLSKSVALLSNTRIREYSWKDDATNKAQIGVIAQEVHAAGFEGAVSVGGDYTETDADGNDVTKYRPWGVDKTAWTFHLIAGYQAQQAQITALEARLAALEAA